MLGPILFLAMLCGLGTSGLEPVARWAAALVVLMATWWITEPIPLALTACLPLLVFPFAGVAPFPVVLLQYFDPVNFLFLGGMWIAAAMQQWGLHRRLALGIIAVIGASPRGIVLGFMLATGFVSLWISNTATAMMMFPIAIAVVLKLAEQAPDDVVLVRRFGLALMLGIAYAASIGGIGTKIGTAPNLVLVKLADQLLGVELDFLTWLGIGLPAVVIALPAVWWYLTRHAAALPATGFAGGHAVIRAERARLGRMSAGEVVTSVAFTAAALLWIFRKDIELGAFVVPGWWRFVTWSWADVIGRPLDSLAPHVAKVLHQDSGDSWVAIVIGAGLLLAPVRFRPWTAALAPRNAARIPWHLLVLLGGGFAMAYGIQASGLSDALGAWLGGVKALAPYPTLVLLCLATVALSEVASNVATASILVPLVGASAAAFGLDAATAMFAVTLSASFGFMLPAGTPPNAIAFASGYISVPQMARAGFAVDVLGALLIATLCYILVPVVVR
jgi:sodium-dependent dicarboxylate transporter 2/3/5